MRRVSYRAAPGRGIGAGGASRRQAFGHRSAPDAQDGLAPVCAPGDACIRHRDRAQLPARRKPGARLRLAMAPCEIVEDPGDAPLAETRGVETVRGRVLACVARHVAPLARELGPRRMDDDLPVGLLEDGGEVLGLPVGAVAKEHPPARGSRGSARKGCFGPCSPTTTPSTSSLSGAEPVRRPCPRGGIQRREPDREARPERARATAVGATRARARALEETRGNTASQRGTPPSARTRQARIACAPRPRSHPVGGRPPSRAPVRRAATDEARSWQGNSPSRIDAVSHRFGGCLAGQCTRFSPVPLASSKSRCPCRRVRQHTGRCTCLQAFPPHASGEMRRPDVVRIRPHNHGSIHP